MDKPIQPKYGENWVQIPMLYKEVTTMESHCPFCLKQVSSWQGDYPEHCKCGSWMDGSYKKAQTIEEQKKEEQIRKTRVGYIRTCKEEIGES